MQFDAVITGDLATGDPAEYFLAQKRS
jgi:hypothetical protein